MRRLIIAALLALGALAGAAAPAAAAGQVCYDVYANIAGNVVAESDCVPLP